MAEDYEVTNTQRVSLFGAAGVPEQGYRVYFQVKQTGWVDYIEVKESEHNPETVAAKIEAKVADHLAVSGL